MAWTGEVSLPMCGATKCGPYKRFGTQTWCLGKYYLLGWIALPHLAAPFHTWACHTWAGHPYALSFPEVLEQGMVLSIMGWTAQGFRRQVVLFPFGLDSPNTLLPSFWPRASVSGLGSCALKEKGKLGLDSPSTLGYLLHWAEYPCHTLGWIALPHLVLVALAHLDIPLSLGWVLLSHFGLDSPSTLAMHLVFLSGQVSSTWWSGWLKRWMNRFGLALPQKQELQREEDKERAAREKKKARVAREKPWEKKAREEAKKKEKAKVARERVAREEAKKKARVAREEAKKKKARVAREEAKKMKRRVAREKVAREEEGRKVAREKGRRLARENRRSSLA